MSPAAPRRPAPDAPPQWPVLQAPSHWRHVDFISDLHLQSADDATFLAWQGYMRTTRADAVFILGDLFEVWVGDDIVDRLTMEPDLDPGFEVRCAQVLQAASGRLSLFFMHGNRDFLLGPAFARACGMTLIADPSVLDFAGQRWLLSHGDALCLADTDYQQFRAQVRGAQWQHDFLGQPLAQRQAVARALRAQSQARQNNAASHADLDANASCDWLHKAHAGTLIHGHTHKPAEHALPQGLRRIVLSDWDGAATPPRAEVLRLSLDASRHTTCCTVQRLAAALAA